MSLSTYRAVFRRELVLLGRFAFCAVAVDPDRLGHGTAVKAALVRIPREHPEAVWESFHGTLICRVPTWQVVNQERASIDKGEAAREVSVRGSTEVRVSARGTSAPSVRMRKVQCWGPIIAEVLFHLAAARPIPRWSQLRGNVSEQPSASRRRLLTIPDLRTSYIGLISRRQSPCRD